MAIIHVKWVGQLCPWCFFSVYYGTNLCLLMLQIITFHILLDCPLFLA